MKVETLVIDDRSRRLCGREGISRWLEAQPRRSPYDALTARKECGYKRHRVVKRDNAG